MALSWKDHWLAIDFVDDGQPFDPLGLPAPDLDAAAEERQVGGLGVHIVRSLVDEARYLREGGRKVVYIDLTDGAAADAKLNLSVEKAGLGGASSIRERLRNRLKGER